MNEFLVFWILVILIVQLLYWLILAVTFLVKERSHSTRPLPVSIIISAKNEAKYLSSLIPKLFNQQHPTIEVVVANDFSTDDSTKILDSFSGQFQKLRWFVPNNNAPGKKAALTEAISLANNDTLLFCDADCSPASMSWANIMSSRFSEKTSIVLGYAPMIKSSGIINIFSRAETFLTAVQYLGAALLGMPYMGVGRNLAYKRSLFKNVGFKSHLDHASGDDDLFIAEVANSNNTVVCMDSDSFVYSPSERTLSSYISQKKRHLSTATRYGLFHKVMLSINPLCHVLFWIFVALLCYCGSFAIVLYILLIRWLLFMVILLVPALKLKEANLLSLFPLLDLCLLLYYLYFSIHSIRGKESGWK